MPSCQVSMTITMLGDCVFREATCMFKDNFPHKLMISAEYLYILSMLYRSSFTLQVKWVGYKADRLFIAHILTHAKVFAISEFIWVAYMVQFSVCILELW